jgi:hypothetical protein
MNADSMAMPNPVAEIRASNPLSIIIPMNAVARSNHCQEMTFSLRITRDRMVAKMGAEYRRETADAIGSICIALKNRNIAIKPTPPRIISMGG